MKEIVAAKINGKTITNDIHKIVAASNAGKVNELYDRKQMQFMASFDLGRHWDNLAMGPTLFFIKDDGTPVWQAQRESA